MVYATYSARTKEMRMIALLLKDIENIFVSAFQWIFPSRIWKTVEDGRKVICSPSSYFLSSEMMLWKETFTREMQGKRKWRWEFYVMLESFLWALFKEQAGREAYFHIIAASSVDKYEAIMFASQTVLERVDISVTRYRLFWKEGIVRFIFGCCWGSYKYDSCSDV